MTDPIEKLTLPEARALLQAQERIRNLTADRDAGQEVEKFLRRVIERERTDLCGYIERLKEVIASRQWLADGRGSYEWDDAKYQDEFAIMIDDVNRALIPLEDIARNHANCPQSTAEVLAARGLTPIPMLLRCDSCFVQHLDEGEWATRAHRTHACASCGHLWRPALVPTVGVLRLANVALGVPS